MAVPKKRTSKAKKNARKSVWKKKADKAAKKSLSLASEKKVKYVIIVGEEEENNNNYILKNLSNVEQKIFNLNDALDHII